MNENIVTRIPMKQYFDAREQDVLHALRDDPEARERRLAKLDLITIVDEIGMDDACRLVPRLGMTEHYGSATVLMWLSNIAACRMER